MPEMTTLATLKAEIADDLDRTDLTTAIASEITKAITFYQDTRFYFNETRDCVIATAADQRLYADEDVEGIVYRVVLDADGEIVEDENGDIVIFAEDSDVTSTGDALADFIEIDQVILEGSEAYELDEMSPKEWELLTASGDNTNKPTHWCYYGGAIGLYPIPDAQYAVRFIGHVKKAAPAADATANNVWMIHAFDLIRSRVCARLALRKIRDTELAAIHTAMEVDEKRRLLSESAAKTGTGFIVPTEF
jgi:hypothetical protein